MEEHFIVYDGDRYPVKEPTIETWVKLTSLKDFTDDNEFSLMLISELTGLSEEKVSKSPWKDVLLVSQNLSNYLLQENQKFYSEFEFQGIKYKFIDLQNLKFGEFIDLDSYLTKSEMDRRRDLHLLMAMLYKEVDIPPLSLLERAEKFKKLPVRYVNGASNFFFSYRKYITGQYPSLFRNKDEDMDDDSMDARESKSFSQHWGWFHQLAQLANEDITKMGEIENYPLILVLNFISYKMDIDNLREMDRKKQLKRLNR